MSLSLLCHPSPRKGRKSGEEEKGRGKEGGPGEGNPGAPGSARPPGDTYWLKSTRERTMNLKMYSRAFMALYSCSLTPGFSALST